MAVFGELGKRVSDAIKTVEKKTSSAAEIGRVNGRLANATQELARVFEQIGKAYYATRDAVDESEGLRLLCDRVAELEREIQASRAQIDRIKGVRRCPNCGEAQPSQSMYCASCGTKLPVAERETPEAPEPDAPEAAAPDNVPDAPDDRQAPETPESAAVEITWPEAQSTDAQDREND